MRIRTDQRFPRLNELKTKIGSDLAAISKAMGATESELVALEGLLI
jgi:hypothetical protein